MKKGLLSVAALATLGLASMGAQAHHRHYYGHDKEVAYLVGGALVGAAIGGLIYSDRYGHRYYGPRVRYYYAPPRRYYRPHYRPYVRHYHPHKHKRHYRRYRHVYYDD